jgi:hypothetical protein
MPEIKPDIRPGDPITAQLLNELISRKTHAIPIRVSPPLQSRSSDGQLEISLIKSSLPFVIKGKTDTGGISARTSDSAHGTGKVNVWNKSSITGVYVDAHVKIDVDYISSTSGGLAAGVWVNCIKRPDGGYEIVSVDCA